MLKSLITSEKQQGKKMNLRLKEEYRVPNPEVINLGEMNIARIWKKTCPICREFFYSYRSMDKDDSYFPDGYLEPTSNVVDSAGKAIFRQTCGSSECYIAEESHWLRVSKFNKGWRHQEQEDKKPKFERPTNLL